ncbi:MAG: glycosyltransferase [Rikenellaceae bacterium]|nr:glycosyltransferase [Rikenellaceae bacterium]
MEITDKKAYFNEQAATLARYRYRRRYYWDSITRQCNYFIPAGSSVLEVGCGMGDLIARVGGSRKVGIDFSEAMIATARERYAASGVQFEVMSAERITLDEKFDVIVLSNLVGYLDDVQAVFEQLRRVSHARTRVIVTYYNHFWEPLIKLAELVGLKRRGPQQNWMSGNDIRNLLYLAGFETFRMNRNMLLPVNIPVVAWLCNKFLARLPLLNRLGLNQYLYARPNPVPETYSVSVVIPARNESGNIEDAILRTPQMGSHTEIIFVEGNSTDDTWDVIQRMQEKYGDCRDVKIARQEGKGKGDAVRKGYSIATGDVLMILDADLTVPPEELPKFYEAIAAGKGEFINGCRLIYPMEKGAMRFLNTLGNKFFSVVFSWLLEQPIKDTLCGTKVIRRTDYIKLQDNRSFFGDFDPFGDFDQILGAYKLNLKIIDLPIRYRERKYGDTNISRFKHGLLLLRMSGFAARKIKFY